MLTVPVTVQSEMTACAAVLGLSGAFLSLPRRGALSLVSAANPPLDRAEDIKGELLEMGILDVLLPLTDSPSVEVRRLSWLFGWIGSADNSLASDS